MTQFAFQVCKPGVPIETLPSIVSDLALFEDVKFFAQQLATHEGLPVRWRQVGQSLGNYVLPQSKTCDAAQEAQFLMGITTRIEAWANVSEQGGWSTHQVAANRQTATELRAHAAQILYP